MNVDQALVIVRAVEDLPDDLDPILPAKAVEVLVAEAAHLAPRELRVLGKGILATLAPDVADAELEKKLAKEERDAAAAARLTMTRDGHGKVHGKFTLSALHGAMLEKALLAIAAPKHRAAVDGHAGKRRPTPERMGRAFGEYLESYPTNRLPQAGGLAATIVVTITLETLMGGLNAACIDTGGLLSASEARRLACQAGIIPVVLGGPSEVLDVARRQTLPPPPDPHRPGDPRRGLCRRGMRLAPRHVPRPPHHPLAPRRRHFTRQRPTPLSPPPRPSPRPHLHDDPPPRRQGRLHPANIGPAPRLSPTR